MLVQQWNKACNCCGNSQPSNKVLDLPFEEIKLNSFAVKCDCGYFYEAVHYPVSFNKWRTEVSKLHMDLEYEESNLSREKEFLTTIGEERSSSEFYENLIKRLEDKIKMIKQKLEILKDPIADVSWKEQ